MLVILFGAPAVFDRYNIRTECEAFNAGRAYDAGETPFCEHGDVTDLAAGFATSLTPAAVCRAAFPIGADGCPDLRAPTLEAVQAWALPAGGTCLDRADVDCEQLLGDADAVRALCCVAEAQHAVLAGCGERVNVCIAVHSCLFAGAVTAPANVGGGICPVSCCCGVADAVGYKSVRRL